MSFNKKKIIPYLWIFFGTFIFIFTRTGTYIPIAIIIAPLFFLHFIKSQKIIKGSLLTLLGFIISLEISLWGLYKIDDLKLFLIFNSVRSFLLAVILFIPYLIDRVLYRRINGFLSTLIFPLSAVTIYFLNSKFGPFNGVGVFFAYTQYGNDSLIQVLSITGLWGLVFFLSWISSFINWMWENEFVWIKIKKGVMIIVSVLLIILLFGQIKTSSFFYAYRGNTVRVAVIVNSKQINDNSLIDVLNNRIFSQIKESIDKIEKLVKTAAMSGAEFIVFQEYYLLIQKSDEEKLINELKRISVENNIYICINYTVIPELLKEEHKIVSGFVTLKNEEKGRNKALLINNKGVIEIEYLKHNLASGEDNWIIEGHGGLSAVDTPYGKVCVAICRDLSLPDYMKAAGKNNTDIVFAPSFESVKSLNETYSQMLRAVENGFSFVRPCNNGLSIAVDYNGKILSLKNYFTTNDEIMYADIPTKGIKTIYVFINDLFAWLCIVALFLFIVLIIKNKLFK